MNSSNSTLHQALNNLLVEIFEGPPGDQAFMLNPGDPGLLRQLDQLNAHDASSRPMPGKTTIAAHVDHVCFGLSLLNRWSAGEANPWAGADWEASWKRGSVTDDQWRESRANLRQQYEAWRTHLRQRTDWDNLSASGSIASVAHTAYHLGAIRQILAALRK